MKVHVLYFASVRETLSRDREALDLPAGIATVGDLRRWLVERGGPYATVFAPGRAIRASVDRAMAKPETALVDGAEVAFFPPVTGG